jgi:hypothetical protein
MLKWYIISGGYLFIDDHGKRIDGVSRDEENGTDTGGGRRK